MGDSTPNTEPPAPEKEIILEEALLEYIAEMKNFFLFALCQQAPEIEEILDKADVIPIVDSPLGIGGTSEYWQTFREASLWEIHQERKRIYRMQDKVEADLDTSKSLFRALYSHTAKLDPLPPVIDHFGVGKFWQTYIRTWAITRKLPIQNRLLILHWCESLRRSGKSPPETNLLSYARNRDDGERGKGRPLSIDRWRKRKQNVVQLLIESDNEYESQQQFYLDLAMEDEKWEIEASYARRYFKRHLDDRYPEDMEEWRQLASYWLVELQVDRKLDWEALLPGWEPFTS